MYYFTNEEYNKLFEAIEKDDKINQFFYMYSAYFRKVKENEKQKTNKTTDDQNQK